MITIKDGQNKILKQFRFSDATSSLNAMGCHVNEIVTLIKGDNRQLKLYYSSEELPNGRMLALINFGNGHLVKS